MSRGPETWLRDTLEEIVGQLRALSSWGATIAGGFRAAAARTPNAEAVIDERVVLTYKQLTTRAARLANGLQERGVAPGDKVALLCRNHAGMVLCFAKALGEFGATITFVSNIPGETQTISAAIYTLTQVPGGDAAAFRLVIVAVVIALVALIASEWFARRAGMRYHGD